MLKSDENLLCNYTDSEMSEKLPILHIVVVGFHHKKGCQVEFSYPPLIPGTEGKHECPPGWKYLPTLALPDGSHNFMEDSVFFNLPSLSQPTESVYGVSCYRQISVEKLKIRTADVTRSTVQKSVCILANLPLYGYIEVKLSLIADAFFEQGDFSCTEILVNAYDHLNACLLDDFRPLRHLDVGLSLRDIVLKWRHKTLLLFKLLLLQRRVVCFSSPVRSMCALILGISSLFPRLLERGFQTVACVRTSRPMSPMPNFSSSPPKDLSEKESNESRQTEAVEGSDIIDQSECEVVELAVISYNSLPTKEKSGDLKELIRANSNGTEVGKRMDRNSLPRDASVDTLASTLFPLTSLNPEAWNAPIPIFSSGHLCLPYLSLPYMDLLTDPSVHSYIIGTSNILFHQKKNLADIQIDIENATLETNDQELRRQLVLTTEDLRFVDFIIRNVQNPKEDAEGSENWIREQFRGYILALAKTAAVNDNTKDCEHFNGQFMTAFKKTQCFQDWMDTNPEEMVFDSIPSGHPFAGTLSVADMKLKIAQTMHNSESGRKINQAVNTTSRAVGGALSQAKGAFSNWWSSITTAPATPNINITGNVNQSSTFQTQSISDSSSDIKQSENFIDGDDDDLIECVDAHFDDHDDAGQPQVHNNTPDTPPKSNNGIIEVAKEAEYLDSNRQNTDTFIV